MRRSVRSRASADSSFSASSTASCTNCLMMSSPHGPSARRPKPPAKPLTPAKPMPWISVRVAVEHDDAGVGQDLADLRPAGPTRSRGCRARPTHGNLDARGDLARERARFFGQAVVGQVAAEHQDVGGFGDLGEQRLQRARRRGAAVVQVAERGDPDESLAAGMRLPPRDGEQERCLTRLAVAESGTRRARLEWMPRLQPLQRGRVPRRGRRSPVRACAGEPGRVARLRSAAARVRVSSSARRRSSKPVPPAWRRVATLSGADRFLLLRFDRSWIPILEPCARLYGN